MAKRTHVRRVADQLTQEDVLVAVQAVDKDVHEPRHLGLRTQRKGPECQSVDERTEHRQAAAATQQAVESAVQSARAAPGM